MEPISPEQLTREWRLALCLHEAAHAVYNLAHGGIADGEGICVRENGAGFYDCRRPCSLSAPAAIVASAYVGPIAAAYYLINKGLFDHCRDRIHKSMGADSFEVLRHFGIGVAEGKIQNDDSELSLQRTEYEQVSVLSAAAMYYIEYPRKAEPHLRRTLPAGWATALPDGLKQAADFTQTHRGAICGLAEKIAKAPEMRLTREQVMEWWNGYQGRVSV